MSRGKKIKNLDIVKKFALEEIYFAVTLTYLYCLNALNEELLSKNFGNDMELLQYDGYVPLKYFVAAIALFLTGAYLVIRRMQRIRHQECYFVELASSIVAVTAIGVLLLLIFRFICIPILRAILITVGMLWMVGLSGSD